MHYRSNVWGPFGWYFLHSISYYNLFNSLSLKEKEGLKLIIISLNSIIPCPECRKHFSQKYKKIDINKLIDNPNELINWIIQIHNEVNKSNKKKSYTRHQVDQLYTLSNERQIINQHQIIKFIDILVKSAKYLSNKQRETGFNQLFTGLSFFYPEKDVSNNISSFVTKNIIDLKKPSNIDTLWGNLDQYVLKSIRNRDINTCFEVKIKYLKSPLIETIYFKPSACGILSLDNWESIDKEHKLILQCKNFDSSINKISVGYNPQFKIENVKIIDYLNLTIDIRLGKRKNNIINF